MLSPPHSEFFPCPAPFCSFHPPDPAKPQPHILLRLFGIISQRVVKSVLVPAIPCHLWIQISWQAKKCRPTQWTLPGSQPHLDPPPTTIPPAPPHPRPPTPALAPTHASTLPLVSPFITPANTLHKGEGTGWGRVLRPPSHSSAPSASPQDLLGWDGCGYSPVRERTRQGPWDPAPGVWLRGSPCP